MTDRALDEDKLMQFLAMYRIGEVTGYETLTATPLGARYRVTTREWEGKRDYVLSVFTGIGLTELPTYTQIATFIRNRGIPAVTPLLTLDGMSTAIFQRRPALFCEEAQGIRVEHPTADHCRSVAQLLAKFHLIEFPDKLSIEVDNIIPVLPQTHLQTLPAEQVAVLGNDAQRIVSSVDFDCLPRGMCHRNMRRESIRFNGTDISALGDIFSAAIDYFALDLAILISDWCLVSEALDENLTAAALEGYDSGRHLSTAESASLPDLIRLAFLQRHL